MQNEFSKPGSNDGLYQFAISFHELPELNHVALGISKTAKALLVRIARRQGETNVCCSMQERQDDQWHQYRSGSEEVNVLTYLMAHQLLGQLQRQHVVPSLASNRVVRKVILQTAQEVSNHVTTACVHCQRPLGVNVARPTTCSPECQEGHKDSWPLETRLSPLLRDPSVLDLLLTCLTAQLRAFTVGPDVPRRYVGAPPPLNDVPFPVDDMLDIINSFPPMVPGVTLDQLLHYGNDSLSCKRREVLEWLCSRFQGMVVPATPRDQLKFNTPLRNPGDPTPTSFLLLNTDPETQSKFEQQLKENHKPQGGVAAFHGSPPQNIFNILCDGLKSSAGNVYYSREPTVSIFYTWRSLSPEQSHIIGQGWRNSRFRGHGVLLGVEVTKPGIFYGPDHETNSHQDTVMIRHLFVLPPGVEETYRDLYGHEYWTQNGSIRSRMETTYSRIHDGRLVREVSEDRVTRDASSY
ncbi:hypothetical protein PG985_000108 [Apiospora marii]|uniref:uncharacterized protein n=1 Tax=Apiospora marii TaxID=335849 RepID=UPI00312D1AED